MCFIKINIKENRYFKTIIFTWRTNYNPMKACIEYKIKYSTILGKHRGNRFLIQ